MPPYLTGTARLRQNDIEAQIRQPFDARPDHFTSHHGCYALWRALADDVAKEQLKRPDEARSAYETALKLDPGNRQASDALAKLK